MKLQGIIHNRRTWLYLFIALTIAIDYLSLIKTPTVQIAFDVRNRTVHFLAYFVYSFIIGMWHSIVNRESKRMRSFAEAGVISILYGSTLEWLQMYLPLRDSDPVDATFNILGGITGAASACFYLSRHYFSRKELRCNDAT
jgi:VanZ family protein